MTGVNRDDLIWMYPREEKSLMSEPTPAVPVTTDGPTASTPEPVLKAAALWGSLSALAITTIGVLVAVGALSSADAELYYSTLDSVSTNLVPVATAIVGVVGLLSGIVSPLVAAVVARRKVTPVADAPVRTVNDGPVL